MASAQVAYAAHIFAPTYTPVGVLASKGCINRYNANLEAVEFFLLLKRVNYSDSKMCLLYIL